MSDLSRRLEWNYWRGTPTLLAHVARTASRAAEAASGSKATGTIDVAVDDDHEVFASADEFAAQVTPDALRRFRSITITAVAGEVQVVVALRWNRDWWKPGEGKDATVSLDASVPDPKLLGGVVETTAAAICRGAPPRSGGFQGFVMGLAVLSTAVVVAAGASSALFLLGLEEANPALPLVVVVVSAATGLVWGAWLYPSLEVAPPGRNNLWRTTKFVGGPVAALVVSGIGKALFA